MDNKILIASISWNPTGWQKPYIDPKSGFEYSKEYPGHESLNFKFNKNNLDTRNNIFGFVQWKDNKKPKRFQKGGIIIFYSFNTILKKGQIVGIYSNVEILDKQTIKNKEFENEQYTYNLKADKKMSMCFPIPIASNNYKQYYNIKRFAGRIGYSYRNIALAEKIIIDELNLLKNNISYEKEYKKLCDIYEYITGNQFTSEYLYEDEIEQEELSNIYEKSEREKIVNDLLKVKEIDTEIIVVNQKYYKRDNKTIAQLKTLRNYKCQICNIQILKKNGKYYIEAAHIQAKSKKGCETPDNILILCPNHHKEFDYGKTSIITHDKEKIEFEMNRETYNISLKIK